MSPRDAPPIWDPTDPIYEARWIEANGSGPKPMSPAEFVRFEEELARHRLDSVSEILDAVDDVWRRYVVFGSEHEAVALTLWVAHTYAFRFAECTPYLWVHSVEYASGKTRTLEVARELVKGPVMTSSASAAALFRKIEEEGGECTFLIDEVDAEFGNKAPSERAEALRQILDGGYRKGNPALRVVGQGTKMRSQSFETFCPKALAGLKQLPRTLASRSVEIRLDRKRPGETVHPFRVRRIRTEVEHVVTRLEEWGENVELPYEPKVTPAGLSDRAEDMWEPLLVIAEAAGDHWPDRARRAALSLSHIDVEDESLNVLLLSHLRDLFGGHEHLHTETVLHRLHQLEEAPWKDYFGREFTARDLAKLLKPFRITSKSVRVGDRSAKGYERDQLTDAFDRYLPTPEKGSQGSQTAPVLTGDVTYVTDVTHFEGTRSEADSDYEPSDQEFEYLEFIDEAAVDARDVEEVEP